MLPCSFKVFTNIYAFLCVKANSKEIYEEISFPSYFQKNADVSIFVEANYLEKIHGYPNFSLWIPIALANICFYRMVLAWDKNLCI